MLLDAVVRVSGRLLGVSPEKGSGGVADALGDALGTLGEVLPAERTSLYRVSQDGDRFDRVAHWCSPALGADAVSGEARCASWTAAQMPWLAEQLSKQEPLCVVRLSELPAEARAERVVWGARGIGSALFVPMVSGGVLLGVLEIEALGRERAWPNESLRLLRIAVDAMASLLSRARLNDSLATCRERLREGEQFGTLGRLAGGIAHDFNNFLTVIIGYTDVLSAGLDEGNPCREDVAEIRHAADRAAALVGKFLSFSGSRPAVPRDIDPNEGVAEMEKILRRIAGDGIEVEFDLAELDLAERDRAERDRADSPARVRIDPSQFDRVLLNLTANARDAMPAGGHLRIATDVVEVASGGVCRGAQTSAPATLAPGRYLLLTVSDTGSGMEEDVVARIFEAFYTTKSPGKGTGLGLATIAGIVAEAGGAIAVETAPQAGATFRIFLPVIASTRPVSGRAGAPGVGDRPGRRSVRSAPLEPNPPAQAGFSIG